MANRHLDGTAWCFTLNNYTAQDILCVQRLAEKCKRWISGKEVSKSGTPHLQGYIVLNDPMGLYTAKKLLPRAWWGRARGNDEQNFNYCSKDEEYECGGFDILDAAKEAVRLKKAKMERAKDLLPVSFEECDAVHSQEIQEL